MTWGTENMPEVEPFNRQHRFCAMPAFIGGRSVELWNAMTKAWDRNPNVPHWPDDYEAAAWEWADLANTDQREHNAAVAAQMGA